MILKALWFPALFYQVYQIIIEWHCSIVNFFRYPFIFFPALLLMDDVILVESQNCHHKWYFCFYKNGFNLQTDLAIILFWKKLFKINDIIFIINYRLFTTTKNMWSPNSKYFGPLLTSNYPDLLLNYSNFSKITLKSN